MGSDHTEQHSMPPWHDAPQPDAEPVEGDRCEWCGSGVSNYRMGCPGCGAPQCCQRCCDEANTEPGEGVPG